MWYWEASSNFLKGVATFHTTILREQSLRSEQSRTVCLAIGSPWKFNRLALQTRISYRLGTDSCPLNNTLHEQNATSLCKMPHRFMWGFVTQLQAGQCRAVCIHGSYLNQAELLSLFLWSAGLALPLCSWDFQVEEESDKKPHMHQDQWVDEVPFPQSKEELSQPQAEITFPPVFPHG